MHLNGWVLAFVVVAFGTGARAADKVAVIDLATPGLAPAEGKALSDNLVGLIAAETSRLGYAVVSSADINAMLSLEKQKDLLGCTEASCLAEIGGALGVPLMVSGMLGKLGDSYSLTLTLVDIQKADVKQRFQGTAGSEAALPSAVKRGVAILFGKAVDRSGSGSAMVVVRTNPAGGTVLLDGKPFGKEPVTLDEVAAGDHVLTAVKGELKGSLALNLASGAIERVTIELKSSPPVKLKVISSPPDARVFIDNREVGRTPLLLSEVASGERHIRLELDHHLPRDEARDLSFAEYEKNGSTPFKLDVTLTPRLHLLPIPVVLMAGATTGADTLRDGVASQFELGIEPARWLELTLGYVHPRTEMLTARVLFYRGVLEVGMLARFAMLQPERSHGFPGPPALSGGLSIGRTIDTRAGFLGVRLEALVNYDARSYVGGLTFPLALAAFWRV